MDAESGPVPGPCGDPETPQDVLALLGRWDGDAEADRIIAAARALMDGACALRRQCQRSRGWTLRQGTVAQMREQLRPQVLAKAKEFLDSKREAQSGTKRSAAELQLAGSSGGEHPAAPDPRRRGAHSLEGLAADLGPAKGRKRSGEDAAASAKTKPARKKKRTLDVAAVDALLHGTALPCLLFLSTRAANLLSVGCKLVFQVRILERFVKIPIELENVVGGCSSLKQGLSDVIKADPKHAAGHHSRSNCSIHESSVIGLFDLRLCLLTP